MDRVFGHSKLDLLLPLVLSIGLGRSHDDFVHLQQPTHQIRLLQPTIMSFAFALLGSACSCDDGVQLGPGRALTVFKLRQLHE